MSPFAASSVHARALSLLILWNLLLSQVALATPVQVKFEIYATDLPVHFLVVEKARQRLQLFEYEETLRPVLQFFSATGANHGNKEKSGDERTPEGIYFITQSYEDSKVTIFGNRAFHLDYPNVFDRNLDKLGNGIYIHGTNKELAPYSTNGCITLTNTDLDQLAPYLTIGDLPVIIVEELAGEPKIQPAPPNSLEFAAIIEEIGLPSQIARTADIRKVLRVTAGQQAVATFSYSLRDGEELRFHRKKRAYLEPGVTTGWRSLFAEETREQVPNLLARQASKSPAAPILTAAQPILAEAAPQPKRVPVTPAPLPPEKPPTVEPSGLQQRSEDLLRFVENWRQAWTTKDLERYMACYSQSFQNGKLDRQGWRAKKQLLNARYDFIEVQIRDVVVEWTDQGAKVSFFQTYRSDKYESSGAKTLLLSLHDNRWQIEREIM